MYNIYVEVAKVHALEFLDPFEATGVAYILC
jgi:hypothetical protein